MEVIYPGVHSDIGGGYPPGDQGKGDSDLELISQIALNDIYAAAYNIGAPLKVKLQSLPVDLQKDLWRVMPVQLVRDFDISPEVVLRFNSWRTLTLSVESYAKDISKELAAKYDPQRAPLCLERALEEQIAWITAWRINRYAGGSYKTQRFYIDSAANGLDKDSDPQVRKKSEAEREEAQQAVEKARRKRIVEQDQESAFLMLPQGPKDFDAALGQTQLRQAADEFREDYHRLSRTDNGNWLFKAVDAMSNAIFLLNGDDEYGEWLKIKTTGAEREKILFPPQGESSNAHLPAGLVRALFDEQIHDSRAWFMHSALGAREPWGSYFLQRMIYFGSRSSKPLTPLMIAGAVVGAATVAGGVAVIIKQKRVMGELIGVIGAAGAIYLETQAIDLLSGKPLSMLKNAAQLQLPTMEPGLVVAGQTQMISEQRLALKKSQIEKRWTESIASALLV